MKHLYESILDNEDDILDDDSSVSEVKIAIKFMDAYFGKYIYKYEVGNMLYNIIEFVDNNDLDISDKEIEYILELDIMDFKSRVKPTDMYMLRAFLNFIKHINFYCIKYAKNMYSPFFSSYFHENLDNEKVNDKLLNKILKSTKQNIDMALNLYGLYEKKYPKLIEFIKNTLKNTTEFIYVEDAWEQDYFIIGHPKKLTAEFEMFVSHLFKTIRRCNG